MELTATKYKQTEIGLIPEDWIVKNIKSITKNIIDFRGVTPKKKGMEWGNGNIVALSAGNVKKGYIDFNAECYFGSEELYKKWMTSGDVSKDDIVFTMEAPLGNVALIPDNKKYILSQRTILLQVKREEINPNYVFQKFISDKFQFYIQNSSTGSTAKGIKRATFEKLILTLPPTLEEQKAIAQVLSDTDDLIQALEKKIAKKKLIKKGVMQRLLTPKDGWVRVKLEDEIDVNRGGSPRPIQDYITDSPSGVNWIKIGDTSAKSKYITSAKEKIIEEGVKNSRQVKVGDFLLSNSMSFGRPYILKINGCIHDGWLVLQDYHQSFNREFLYYTLMSKDVFNQYISKASGSGVLNLNKELVKTVELNKPVNIGEQVRIAKVLSNMDEEIELLEKKLLKYQLAKQGMMQQLLTGKIRLV